MFSLELLKEKERAAPTLGPGKGKTKVHREPSFSEYAQAKTEAGISDTRAKRWQKLANVPEEKFEAALKDPDHKLLVRTARCAVGFHVFQ